MLLFKIDLSRAFRQLPIDPGDYNLLCLHWKDGFYSDVQCPFGHKFGSLICTRLVQFFRYLMWQRNYDVFCYVDDVIGCVRKDKAQEAYEYLLKLLQDLNLAQEKTYLIINQVLYGLKIQEQDNKFTSTAFIQRKIVASLGFLLNFTSTH